MQPDTVLRFSCLAALLALLPASHAAQLSVTPSYPVYGDEISLELRDTKRASYLQATRYTRTGWAISIEYEYAGEAPVAGRADFGNPVLQLGELVPGTYSVEARLSSLDDPDAAVEVVKQEVVVLPPARWGLYLVPRAPTAFAPTDVLVSSAVYLSPGSMQASVNGNVIRVDFDYDGHAPVGSRMSPGLAPYAATRIPALPPGTYVVEGWGRDTVSGGTDHFFTRELVVGAAVQVIEFYSASLDQYLMRASAGDVALVESGRMGAWKRTGQQFRAWLRMGDGPEQASPVCSFHVEGSSSRFYTGAAGDCAYLKTLETRERADSIVTGRAFPGWSYDSIAFYALLPQGGECPAGSDPVYRSYNDRAAGEESNHRFTTNARQRAAMAMSWIDEGIAFCSPRQ
jgi:hypothetical protein